MKKNILITTLLICAVFLLTACSFNSKDENYKRNAENEQINEYEKENYVSIQDYNGEGFTLRDANPKTGEIAEENREEVEKAVEHFFFNKYKSKVKVQNIVSADDGVSVFVESLEEPHFYSFAIVPVDVKSKKVKTDQVWSQEGQIENAIQGGLYAMAYKDEFTKLENYLDSIAAEHPIVGTPIEVIENVKGNGYTSSYYFVSTFDDVFDDLFELYLSNPEITHQELETFFAENPFGSEGVAFGIEFYMKDIHTDPDKEMHDKLYSDIEELDGIPKGEYHIFLNDSYIDRKRGIGKKENTLEKNLIKDAE